MAKRKYRRAHQAERAKWAPEVEAGRGWCVEPVCLMPSRWIQPGTAWHLAHDTSGTIWIGVSHARCNSSEGARRGNRSRVPTSGRWVL